MVAAGWPLFESREILDDLDRLYADANYLADEADDVLGVVGSVGVGRDAAALVGAHLILVDDPFQGAAVPEANTRPRPPECQPACATR